MNIDKPAQISAIAVAPGADLSDHGSRHAGAGAVRRICRAEDVSLGAAVRAYQERLIGQLRNEGLLVAGHVVELRENSPSETIREVAESLNASLLVIGSHGRS